MYETTRLFEEVVQARTDTANTDKINLKIVLVDLLQGADTQEAEALADSAIRYTPDTLRIRNKNYVKNMTRDTFTYTREVSDGFRIGHFLGALASRSVVALNSDQDDLSRRADNMVSSMNILALERYNRTSHDLGVFDVLVEHDIADVYRFNSVKAMLEPNVAKYLADKSYEMDIFKGISFPSRRSMSGFFITDLLTKFAFDESRHHNNTLKLLDVLFEGKGHAKRFSIDKMIGLSNQIDARANKTQASTPERTKKAKLSDAVHSVFDLTAVNKEHSVENKAYANLFANLVVEPE